MLLVGKDPKEKPTGQVEIRWGHELSRGLVFACLCDDYQPLDLVSQKFATRTGTATTTCFAEGEALSGSVGWAWSSATGMDSLTTAGTIFVMGTMTNGAGSTGSLVSDVSGTADGVGFAYDDSLQVTNGFYLWGSNDIQRNSGFDALGLNAHLKLHKGVITWNGTNIVFFANGAQITAPADNFTASTHSGRRTRIKANFGSSSISTQLVATAYAWDRVLSADEIKNLTLDTWGFIEPKVIRAWNIPQVVAGGGGTVVPVLQHYRRQMEIG